VSRGWLASLPLLFALGAHGAESTLDDWDDWGDEDEEEVTGLVWTGFAEAGVGVRIDGGDDPDSLTLGDLRFQAKTEWVTESKTLQFKGDGWYDGVSEQLEFDLRELSLRFSPAKSVDVSIGQQVLTWGTGDLVFLNDLFPKDFQSFFSGRDDEYLKAPSAAVRVTHYGEAFNTDLVWTPEFTPDRYLTGERFSFFDPRQGQIAVPEPRIGGKEPSQNFSNGEFAIRMFKRIEATEVAVYGYRGFYKQPLSVDEAGQFIHPSLSVYGASLRRPAGSGVFSGEFAWYDSRDDRSGDDPNVPNSQARILFGYERELVRNWQLGLQYYGEWTANLDRLRRNAPPEMHVPDELRSLLTARVTGRLRRETLILSLFIFASPTDKDLHLRPRVSLRMSDTWTVTGGANLFYGDEVHTFFGQLEENNNVYLRVTRFY